MYNMNVFEKVIAWGPKDIIKFLFHKLKMKLFSQYYIEKAKQFPVFRNLVNEDFREIDTQFQMAKIQLSRYNVSNDEWRKFTNAYFDNDAEDYFVNSPNLREEKTLEHFISYKLCGLTNCISPKHFTYIDIAGGGSPWVNLLRKRNYDAYALDLFVSPRFRHFSYYLKGDGTSSTFADESVDAISLQCAFELFIGNSDIQLIDEISRVLKPNGKAIILPLYMHKEYCGYSSPENILKGYADPEAKRYVRNDIWGIPFSRKYDVDALNSRILDRIEKNGMQYKIYILTGLENVSSIYCRYVLEITK